MRITASWLAIFSSGIMTMSFTAHADGLSDLKAALARSNTQQPIKAMVEASKWTAQGEGKERDETRGDASVFAEEDARGIQVLYSKELVTRLETEEQAQLLDPKNKTPTQMAVKELDNSRLHAMLDGAVSLQHHMERTQYKGEKEDSYNGTAARLLTFSFSIDRLNEKDRKYVKNFDGTLQIWISADGTPLASHQIWNLSGRALVFISFASKSDESETYTWVGNRLVITKSETMTSNAGGGEKQESKAVKTLRVQS